MADISTFAMGDKELFEKPLVGSTIDCKICGENHKVENGKTRKPDGAWEETSILQYYRCKGKLYLCGIKGRSIS